MSINLCVDGVQEEQVWQTFSPTKEPGCARGRTHGSWHRTGRSLISHGSTENCKPLLPLPSLCPPSSSLLPSLSSPSPPHSQVSLQRGYNVIMKDNAEPGLVRGYQQVHKGSVKLSITASCLHTYSVHFTLYHIVGNFREHKFSQITNKHVREKISRFLFS